MEILPHSCYNGRENGQSKEVSAVKRRLLPPAPLWRRVSLALYRFFPVPAVPLAAAGAVFLVFVLFPLAAWLRRRRRGGRKDPYA